MEFIISLLSTPAVLLGVVACIGLILQKKSAVEVFTGSSKTLIGFLIFGIGASAMTGALQNFNKLFQHGFGITGVIASPCTRYIWFCSFMYINSWIHIKFSICTYYKV